MLAMFTGAWLDDPALIREGRGCGTTLAGSRNLLALTVAVVSATAARGWRPTARQP
jgi:hypothetical protein